MKRVLFLCTGNSCRSQMAKRWLLHLGAEEYEVSSAGTDPQKLNPLAGESTKECGIDISRQWSNSVNEFSDQSFDYVITVCDHVRESCPTFSNASTVLHWSVPDPAKAEGSHEERHHVFCQVRDQIKKQIGGFVKAIQ